MSSNVATAERGVARPVRSLRWGLVGASTIAREWMIPAFRAVADQEAVAICSSSLERATSFGQDHGLPLVFDDLTAFLDCPEIDAVYISTTNEHHVAAIEAAARAGKHILCEKPLALSVADARRAVRFCEESGVVLATNHHFRNNACARVARELIAAGELGRPVAARVTQALLLPEELRGWRLTDLEKGGGVILDLAVHDADLLRFVLQDEVIAVKAMSTSTGLKDGGLDDTALGVMRFSRGVLASFYDAYNSPDGGSSLEIHGTTGSLIIPDALDERLIARAYLRRGEQEQELDLGATEDLYVYGLRRFAAAVAGAGVPAASAEDGVRSLAVALAVQRSAMDGTEVSVAYDADL